MGFGGFGGPGGGLGGGPRAAANPGGGLPFAGIPSELQDGVDKLLRGEPKHRDPDSPFSSRDGRREGEAHAAEPHIPALAARRC